MPFSHGYSLCYAYVNGQPDWHTNIFIDKSGNVLTMPSNGYALPNSKTKTYNEIQIGYKTILQDNFFSVWSKRGNLSFVKGAYDFCICDEKMNIVKSLPPNSWLVKGVNPDTGNQWCEFNGSAYDFTGAENKSPVPGFEPVAHPVEYSNSYDYFDGFSEGLSAAMSKDGEWCYVDTHGKVKIKLPKDCSNAQEFSEGLAAVSIGGTGSFAGGARISPKRGAHFGYIDKTGKFVIPPQFPCPSYIEQTEISFKNGLAKVTGIVNGALVYGVIDKSGSYIVKPAYVLITDFHDGLAAVDAGPVGFDQEAWNKPRKPGFFGSGPALEQEFSKFLREYHS